MNRSDSEHEKVRDVYPYDYTSDATLDEVPPRTMPADRNVEPADSSTSEMSSPEAPAFVTSELNNELGGGASHEALPANQNCEADIVSTSNHGA